MALTVEDGTGIVGAESYVSVADALTYWGNRTQDSRSATFTGAAQAIQEGALREASAYLDAVYGPYYLGKRRATLQGLLWPRSEAKDDEGYNLPEIPPEIVRAASELAARAVSGNLAADVDRGGATKRERVKAGSVESETEYFDGANRETTYGFVARMLAPVLNGQQPDAPADPWGMA